MKKIIAFTLVFAAGFMLHAGNDDRALTTVTNYHEVLSNIIYPTESRAEGIEGTVMIEIYLNKSGDIQRYKILESPCKNLTSAVTNAIPELEFIVPEVDGKAVKSKVIIPVKFQLEI